MFTYQSADQSTTQEAGDALFTPVPTGGALESSLPLEYAFYS